MDTTETMSGMLARLNVADQELLEEIEGAFNGLEHVVEFAAEEHEFEMDIQETYEKNEKVANDLIQGCCQRAIAARGWDLSQYAKNEMRGLDPHSKIEFQAIINRSGANGESHTSALLAAYLKAVEA